MIKPSVKIATPKSQGYNSRHALEAVKCVLEKRYSDEFALDQFTGWKKLVEKDGLYQIACNDNSKAFIEIDAIYSEILDPITAPNKIFKKFTAAWYRSVNLFKNTSTRCSKYERLLGKAIAQQKI